VESSCELGNEPSGSIKCWESTEWLHKLWPLERYSAPQLVLCNINNIIYNIIHDIHNIYNYIKLSDLTAGLKSLSGLLLDFLTEDIL
jgi:hypothetical protein